MGEGGGTGGQLQKFARSRIALAKEERSSLSDATRSSTGTGLTFGVPPEATPVVPVGLTGFSTVGLTGLVNVVSVGRTGLLGNCGREDTGVEESVTFGAEEVAPTGRAGTRFPVEVTQAPGV